MTAIYPKIVPGLKVRHRETLREHVARSDRPNTVGVEDMGTYSLSAFWETFEPIPQPGDRVRVVRTEHGSICIGHEGWIEASRNRGLFLAGGHEGPLFDFEVILPEEDRRAATTNQANYEPTSPDSYESDLGERVDCAVHAAQLESDMPHSRACGVTPHKHGARCAVDCPSCVDGYGHDYRKPEESETNMTDNETVAVPVELIRRVLYNEYQSDEQLAMSEMAALLPKPKPRLVAVSREQWDSEDSFFDLFPDLLDTLDAVIDSTAVPPGWVPVLKSKIRMALGVTE